MTTPARKYHGRIIETRTRIRTTPARVWEAWADPQQIANWFVDRAEGRAIPGEIMTWMFDAFNIRQPVPIVEAKPGETFVIGSGDTPGPYGHPYLLEITIARDGDQTVVRLVNSGFSEDANFDEEYSGVVSGWQMALGVLKHWLERYPDSARAHRIVFEPTTYPHSALRPLFVTEEGRRRWLEPAVPAESDVLVDTGTEILLAWEAQRAVVGLKAFRMGSQRMVALDLSAWNESPLDLDAIEAQFRHALNRINQALAAR